MNRRRPRAAVAVLADVIVVVVAALCWSKMLAFTRTAHVQIDITANYAPPSEGTVYSANLLAIDVPTDRLSERVPEELAASRGGRADDYSGDLTFVSEETYAGIAVTAKGRTPSAARDLANAAAAIVATMYTSPPGSTETATVTATFVPVE